MFHHEMWVFRITRSKDFKRKKNMKYITFSKCDVVRITDKIMMWHLNHIAEALKKRKQSIIQHFID